MKKFIIRAFNLAIISVVALLACAGCAENDFVYDNPLDENGTSYKKFTITFNANGGYVSPTSYKTVDGKLASLPIPTRSDYEFDGWYTSSSGGVEVTRNTEFTWHTTIYAQWTQRYTITFDQNYSGAPSATTAATGTDGKLTTLPTPTRSGYTFSGWFTAASGGTPVTTSTVFSANATIYAQWTQNYVEKGNDIRNYKTVQIGTQRWMAENLDYDVPSVTSDVCYNNSADSCAKYGRLYNWSTAMNGASSSSASPSGVRGVCPVGWHLPSDAEWTVLTDYVGGSSTAGTKLKSPQYWESYSGVPKGTDDFGFSALPGGFGFSGGSFCNAGCYGNWWSATESGANFAWGRDMYYDDERVVRSDNSKTNLYSVRCVQD